MRAVRVPSKKRANGSPAKFIMAHILLTERELGSTRLGGKLRKPRGATSATMVLVLFISIMGVLMSLRAVTNASANPATPSDPESKNVVVKWAYTTGGMITASASFADIDGDNLTETIIGSHDKNLYCFNGAGGVKWTYATVGAIGGAPGIGDIDKDDKTEVVTVAGGIVYCLNYTGGTKWTYGPVRAYYVYHLGDGIFPIAENTAVTVIGAYGDFYGLNSTGGYMWSYMAPSWVQYKYHDYPNQVRADTGDVDGDNQTETAMITSDGKLSCKNWTYTPEGKFTSNPVVADVDADGKLEILAGADDSKIYCLSSFGKLDCFYQTGGTVYSTAAVTDVDGDNRPEIVVGSSDGRVYCLSAQPSPLLLVVEFAAITFFVAVVAATLVLYRHRNK